MGNLGLSVANPELWKQYEAVLFWLGLDCGWNFRRDALRNASPPQEVLGICIYICASEYIYIYTHMYVYVCICIYLYMYIYLDYMHFRFSIASTGILCVLAKGSKG